MNLRKVNEAVLSAKLWATCCERNAKSNPNLNIAVSIYFVRLTCLSKVFQSADVFQKRIYIVAQLL